MKVVVINPLLVKMNASLALLVTFVSSSLMQPILLVDQSSLRDVVREITVPAESQNHLLCPLDM